MEHLNNVNQDNKLLEKAYKRKVQQTQAYTTRGKSYSQSTSSKTNKTGQNQRGRHNGRDSDKKSSSNQAIQEAEQESDYESESDHDQVVLGLLPHRESDN